MVRRRIVALVTAVALCLAVSAVRPSKAYALNEWAWAGIGVAAWAVIVTVGTLLVFHQPLAAEGKDQLQEAEDARTVVQVRPNCRPSTDGNLNLVCW